MTNPRRLGFLTLVSSTSSTVGSRWFELDEDRNWIELFPVEGYDLMFPATACADEISLAKNEIDREREVRRALEAFSLNQLNTLLKPLTRPK